MKANPNFYLAHQETGRYEGHTVTKEHPWIIGYDMYTGPPGAATRYY